MKASEESDQVTDYAPRSSTCLEVMKLKFGFVKVRYRGLAKNANRLFCHLRAGRDLFMVRKKLLGAVGA